MRTIEHTGQFKRDYKREAKGQYRATMERDLATFFGRLDSRHYPAIRYEDKY
jgi:mRNA interferase YafQ